MSCTICTKTKPIPQCSGVLELGAVSQTDVQVVVTEVVTNRQRLIDGAVTIGILTIDLDDLGEFLSPNLLYAIQAYDTGVANFGTPIDITIDEVEYTCLNLSVTPLVNTEGEIEGAETFVIQIDE
jgi:hypothetical protein